MNTEILNLSAKFAAYQESHEQLSAALKANNEAWGDCEKQLIDAMKEEGVNAVDIDGIGNVKMQIKKMPSVRADAKPDFFGYLRKAGHGDLIKEDVNTRTLQSFLKKHVAELAQSIEDDGLDALSVEILGGDMMYQGKRIAIGVKFDAMDASLLANEILKTMGASVYETTEIKIK